MKTIGKTIAVAAIAALSVVPATAPAKAIPQICLQAVQQICVGPDGLAWERYGYQSFNQCWETEMSLCPGTAAMPMPSSDTRNRE